MSSNQTRPYEPILPESSKRINQYTFHVKERLWMNNLASNMQTIRAGYDISDLPHEEKTPAIVLAAGPSVSNYRQLKLIAKSDFKGHILICDKMLRSSLESHIIPRYIVSTDGDPQVAEFFPKGQGSKRSLRTTAIFNAMTVHPNTVKVCHYPIYWFISMLDDPYGEMSLTRAVHYMTDKTMLESMGNVGGTTWHLAYFLGYDPIALVGMDYGYPKSTHIEETIYYKAYLKLAKGDQKIVRGFFDLVPNPDTGKEVLIDMNFNAYREILLPYLEHAKCTTINCSPESTLFGKGIKYQPLEEFLNGRNI